MSRRPAWLLSLAGFGLGLLVVVSGDAPDAVGQQPKALVVPPAPQAPTLTTPANLGGKRGTTAELTLTGTNLAGPTAVLVSCNAKVSFVEDKKGDPAKQVKVKVEIPADTPIGLYTVRVATKNGVSNLRPFVVDELPEVPETDGNRTKDTAQPVAAPCVVTGRTDAEASDFFKVKVAAGRRLTFEVLARRTGSPLDPILVLHDGKTKRELVDLYADDTPGLQSDCRLTHTFKEAGEVIVEVRDSTYRGGADFFYRLRVGEFPGATTAFPLMAQRGKAAKVGFAGPGMDAIRAVSVNAPSDPAQAVVYVAPKGKAGASGWPVPVRLSDHPELVEQEPNDEPAKANKVPVPGGISAKFGGPGDIDHFAFPGKKGQKLVVSAMTYEVNAPTEVLVRVLDAKGAEVARSNPAQPGARAEFTPAADGEFVAACEHLLSVHGPNEVYHLSVVPAAPDFTLTLALDRYEAPAGGGTAVAVATVGRVNGFAGPIELSIVGDETLSGKVTVPNGQTTAFVPLMIDEEAKPGAYPFRVRGTATVGGQEVVRFAASTDLVKAALGGMPNPPVELLGGCAVAVVEKPPFTLKVTADPPAVEKGKAGKLRVEATRDGFDADIPVAVLYVPPSVTAAAKPVPKGQTKAEIALTVAANAAVGAHPLVLRATAKVGGKDYAVTPPPAVVEVIAPKKKEEPKKKDEPKKEKKDKP
jgi:hypothetical protein